MSVAALAAALLLVGAASAWAAFVVEGSPYTVGNDPYSLAAGDFNNDGRPDVATFNGTSSDVSVFLRQAGGGFAQEGSPIPIPLGPSGGVTADMNGDGLLDLVVSSFDGTSVSVLLRQAGGGFAHGLGSPLSMGTRISSVAVGNFNGDGLLDLAATAYDFDQVLLRLRSGTSFVSGQTLSTGDTPVGIATADYDGNGLTDLAVANRLGDSVTILMQASGGTFGSEAALQAGDDPIGIVAANFDGTGGPDLAVTNAAPGTVTSFLRRPQNDGFNPEAPVQVSASPVGIDALDFNVDGRPDLAVAANAGAVDVLARNAGGGFTLDQSIPRAAAVNDVEAADFDGDSRPDLAATSYTTTATPDTFSVMLNPAPPAPPGPTPTPPVAGETVNAEPVSGTVRFKRPGSRRFVTLTGEQLIPVGSTVDTRRGRVTITAAQGGGRTASSDFFDGLFKLTQTKGRRPLTTLTLTEKLSCPRKGSASAAAKKKKKRKLWGDGSGRFRTKGKHSAATVVGTRWLVEDRCTSTLTRVRRGRVKVRDFAKRKTVTVRAGKRYVARAKRR